MKIISLAVCTFLTSFASANDINLSNGKSFSFLNNNGVETSISCGNRMDLPRCIVQMNSDYVTFRYSKQEFENLYVRDFPDINNVNEMYELAVKFAKKYEEYGKCIFLDPSL